MKTHYYLLALICITVVAMVIILFMYGRIAFIFPPIIGLIAELWLRVYNKQDCTVNKSTKQL